MTAQPKKILIFALSLIAAGLVIWLGYDIGDSAVVKEVVGRFGYVGIFVIAALSGFNVVFPIPAIAFLPFFIAGGFPLWSVVLVTTLGMTAGDLFGYLIGRAGHNLAHSRRAHAWAEKIEALEHRYRIAPAFLLLFFIAFVPLPNELIVIPLAFIGFRARTILPIVLVGNLIFNTLAAFGLWNISFFFDL